MNHKDLHNKVFDFINRDIEEFEQLKNVSITNYSKISTLNNFEKKI